MTPAQLEVLEAINLPHYEHEFGWRYAVIFLSDAKTDKECFRVNDFGDIYYATNEEPRARKITLEEAKKIARLVNFR